MVQTRRGRPRTQLSWSMATCPRLGQTTTRVQVPSRGAQRPSSWYVSYNHQQKRYNVWIHCNQRQRKRWETASVFQMARYRQMWEKTTAHASTNTQTTKKFRKAKGRAEVSPAADPQRLTVSQVKARIKADVEADPRRQARKSYQIRHYCATPI